METVITENTNKQIKSEAVFKFKNFSLRNMQNISSLRINLKKLFASSVGKKIAPFGTESFFRFGHSRMLTYVWL